MPAKLTRAVAAALEPQVERRSTGVGPLLQALERGPVAPSPAPSPPTDQPPPRRRPGAWASAGAIIAVAVLATAFFWVWHTRPTGTTSRARTASGAALDTDPHADSEVAKPPPAVNRVVEPPPIIERPGAVLSTVHRPRRRPAEPPTPPLDEVMLDGALAFLRHPAKSPCPAVLQKLERALGVAQGDPVELVTAVAMEQARLGLAVDGRPGALTLTELFGSDLRAAACPPRTGMVRLTMSHAAGRVASSTPALRVARASDFGSRTVPYGLHVLFVDHTDGFWSGAGVAVMPGENVRVTQNGWVLDVGYAGKPSGWYLSADNRMAATIVGVSGLDTGHIRWLTQPLSPDQPHAYVAQQELTTTTPVDRFVEQAENAHVSLAFRKRGFRRAGRDCMKSAHWDGERALIQIGAHTGIGYPAGLVGRDRRCCELELNDCAHFDEVDVAVLVLVRSCGIPTDSCPHLPPDLTTTMAVPLSADEGRE